MRVELKNRSYVVQQDFPLSDLLLQDVLDKLRAEGRQVNFEIMHDSRRRMPESIIGTAYCRTVVSSGPSVISMV